MSRAGSVLQLLQQIAKQRIQAGGLDAVLHKIKIVDGAEGKCTCELPVTQEISNIKGVLHGGTTALLIDAVSTWALMTTANNVPGVSINMNISYMKSVPIGSEIVINAHTLHVGRKLAFLSVDICNKADGTVVAQGKHTKYVGGNSK